MKKIIILISAALLFTISCTDFPDETRIGLNSGPKVEITVLDNVKQMSVIFVRKDVAPFIKTDTIFKPNPDSMFCFKMKTTDDASFFSYLITEAKESIEAFSVLRCAYSGVKGTFKYGENNATTNTAKEIVIMVADNRYKPNVKDQEIEVVPAGNDTILVFTSLRFTTYQIYAASGHKNGGVGELSNSSVRKTDNKVRPLRSSSDDGIISISFTEAIKRGEGKITGNYYFNLPAALAGTIEIEEDNISVYENILEISLSDKFPPGAHVCITWELDVVQDLFGKSAEEYTTKGISGGNWLGFYVRQTVKPWKLEGPEEKLIKFHDKTNFRIVLSCEPPEPPIVRNQASFFDVLITYKSDGKEITINLPGNFTSIVNGNVSIRLPQEALIDANALVSIKVNADSYVDKYGNGNETFVMNDKYKFVTQYVISASAGENGNITPKGDRNVNVGANQTYTITPNAGYHIDKVLIDGENDPAAVANGTYTFTNVVSDHTIVASFAKN